MSRRTEISYEGRVPAVSEHNIAKPIADPGNTVNEVVVQGKTATLIRGGLVGIASATVSGAPFGEIQGEINQESAEVIVSIGSLGLPYC